MLHNIIEIQSDNISLSANRGFMQVSQQKEIIKNIALDSIDALLITGFGVMYSNNLLQALCEYGIPLVVVGKNYHPSGILLSFIGKQNQSDIQKQQFKISKPLQKQLWQIIVQEKIANQSKTLTFLQLENPILDMPNRVLSGDTTNIEAQAARLYFPIIFGKDFIRNPNLQGINSFLNYGYAIIRASLARQVVAVGLNPSFGVKHYNKLNPFCLVDDMIEPFRSIVDFEVYKIFNGQEDLNRELESKDKQCLAEIINKEYKTNEGYSPLCNIMQKFVWSFSNSILNKKNELIINLNLFY